MSRKGLSMRKIGEILRLKYEAGLSQRSIAQSCSVSPSTVSEYVTHAKAGGRNIPEPNWAKVHRELRHKSVTLSLLWVEYRQEQPDGYGFNQFCYQFRRWAKQLKLMMRQGAGLEHHIYLSPRPLTSPEPLPEVLTDGRP